MESVKSNEPQRKRGRPAGKHRVPLSLEERRARNAQYERERRIETAEAMAQLAEAAGCATDIPSTDLLATVVDFLKRSSERPGLDDVGKLRQINDNLAYQIETLERRLAEEPDLPGCMDVSDDGAALRTHSNERDRKHVKLELESQTTCNPQSVIPGLDTSWSDIGDLVKLDGTDECEVPEISPWSIEDFIQEYL